MYKVLCGIMLCLVVNFVFSNTVFTHSHLCIDGHTITHSHPYHPGAHHHHSCKSLDQIASFNLGAASMEASACVDLIAAHSESSRIEVERTVSAGWMVVPHVALRAPPVEM